MLKGIAIKTLKRHNDERGSFTEIMREDWSDLLGGEHLVQTNLSISHPCTIRAWHRHARGQTDFFVVLKGAAKICAYDETTKELSEIISTGQDMQVVKIPGTYWHGFKVMGAEPAWMLYYSNRLYDRDDPDEERRLWNDPTVIPRSINGNRKDARVDKPWDWNYPPHR